MRMRWNPGSKRRKGQAVLAWALLWGWLAMGSEVGTNRWGSAEVEALMRRVAERSRLVSADTNATVYLFDKLTVLETLDGSGAVKKVKEKKYEVSLRHGMTHNRLLEVDGVPLGPAESAAQSEKEKKWRDTYSATKGGASAADRADDVLNERLFSRFRFTATGEERVRDRNCVVLEFVPKTGDLPDERLVDKIINLMGGRIWVDVEEAEITRAEAETRGGLKLWGGVLGSLESFRIHVDRERSPLGPWFNRHMEVAVRGRRLFTTMNMRVREVGARLRRAEGEASP